MSQPAIIFGNICTAAFSAGLFYYAHLAHLHGKLLTSTRTAGVLLLVLVAVSLALSRFGTRRNDLQRHEEILIAPGVLIGWLALAILLVVAVVFLLWKFIEGLDGFDFDLGGIFDGGGKRRARKEP
jgi:hypothetical protein